jgi:hypothetical protein
MKMNSRSKKPLLFIIGIVLIMVVGIMLLASHQNQKKTSSAAAQIDSPLKYGLPATSQEITSKRTLNSKTFRNANGTYTAVIAQSPIHYKDNSGTFQDIKLAFVKQRDEFTSDKNNVKTQVSTRSLQTVNPKTGKGVVWIIPSQFTVSNNIATYTSHGLTWTYQLTSAGTKLSAKVAEPQGKKTYSFQYQLVGGAKGFMIDNKTGDLIGDGFMVPKVTVTGKDGKDYPVSGWEMIGQNQIAFILDDSSVPKSAYPYVIDPTTTFDVTASGDDGFAQAEGLSYPPTGGITSGTSNTTNTVSRSFDGPGNFFTVANVLIRWDTSSLAGKTITAATFHGYSIGMSNTDSRSLTADWYSSSNWPIDSTDYSETAQTSAISGTALSSITTNAYNDFTLQDASTNINTSGYTGIRLHISGGQPTGNNFVTWDAFDNGSNIPELIVTYTDSTTWFDSSWQYRKGLTITNSTGSSLTNMQKLITVDTATLIAAGKLQSNCNDLRFADSSGNALSYYIDSGCNTSSTKIWVMIPSLPTGNSTFYMYYGNNTATQGSSSTNFDNLVDMIGYWTFNDGSGSTAKDSSVNANDGTVIIGGSGSQTTTTQAWSNGISGEYAGSIKVDGTDDYIQVPDSSILDINQSGWTISAWINPSGFYTGSCLGNLIVGKGSDNVAGFYALMINDANGCGSPSATKHAAADIVFSDGTKIVTTGTTNLTTGNWYFLSAVYDGSTIKIYVNGSLENTALTSGKTVATNSDPLLIAKMNNASFPYWVNGKIDDVHIYNTARTGTQIASDYSTTYAIQTAGLNTTYTFLSEEVYSAPPTATPAAGHMDFNRVRMNGIRIN